MKHAEQAGKQDPDKGCLGAAQNPHGGDMTEFHEPCGCKTGRVQATHSRQYSPERHHQPIRHSKDKAPNGVLKWQTLPLHHQTHQTCAAHQASGHIQDQIDNL